MAYKNSKVLDKPKSKRVRHRVRTLEELIKPSGICPKCGKPQTVEAIATGAFHGNHWYLWRKTCQNKKCGYVWESKRYKLDVYEWG